MPATGSSAPSKAHWARRGRVLLPAARLFCRTGGIPIEIKRKTLRRAEWWGGWEMRFAWGGFAGFGVQGVAALVLARKQVAHIAAGGSAQKLAFGL